MQEISMLEAFGFSDAGCVRSNNEDYFINDAAREIFILADGMGGAAGGEFASQLSAEKVYQTLTASGNGKVSVEDAFVAAHHYVQQAAIATPDLDGMATTLLLARAIERNNSNGVKFEVASVGDSRAYHHRRGALDLITRDQTWVVEVGSRLGLSEEELKTHYLRHVLTMAVGIKKEDLRVFSCTVDLSVGDQILLCSDGLHGVVSEKILLEALESEKTIPDKCHYLVDAAKEAGGPDNITVLLVRVT
jgi:protein phosphatase